MLYDHLVKRSGKQARQVAGPVSAGARIAPARPVRFSAEPRRGTLAADPQAPLPWEDSVLVNGKAAALKLNLPPAMALRLWQMWQACPQCVPVGSDGTVDQATLERKGRTIAVLGTGLDEKSLYPKDNIKLAKKIIETGGCLISEYPSGTGGTHFTFPQRNRIVSGLSLGVLVVEAKPPLPNFGVGVNRKSGSGAIITAFIAFEQGRKVFALPGPVHSSNSKGCHFLIKKGAKLVENANDILLELNLPKKEFSSFQAGENKEENLVLECIKEEALYIDKIIEKTKLNASAVAGTLAILEIKGKVKNLGGNVYAINYR